MSYDFSKILDINTEYTDHQLEHLRTFRVDTESQISEAYDLIRGYSFYPVKRVFLKQVAQYSTRGVVEILYGPYGECQEGSYIVQPEAAVVFINSKEGLVLIRFAHDPWFEPELAIAWAEYRIEKAKKEFESKYISWYVDEENVTLQLELSKRGYLASTVHEIPHILNFVK